MIEKMMEKMMEYPIKRYEKLIDKGSKWMRRNFGEGVCTVIAVLGPLATIALLGAATFGTMALEEKESPFSPFFLVGMLASTFIVYSLSLMGEKGEGYRENEEIKEE